MALRRPRLFWSGHHPRARCLPFAIRRHGDSVAPRRELHECGAANRMNDAAAGPLRNAVQPAPLLKCKNLVVEIGSKRIFECERVARNGRIFGVGAGDNGADMVVPDAESGTDFPLIPAAVIGAGDAAPVAGLVIQDLFNDVRPDAEIGHACSCGAAQIVNSPILNAGTGIDAAFTNSPVGISRGPADAE